MSNITVRFVHCESRTPVLELEVEASVTVGALRELLMERLASEEACMMRVFVKWHVEVEAAGRKRLIELTVEDSEASLSSIGISHLSEVHLDGPLTGDSAEGVGQALAVLGAQMNRMDKGLDRIATILETLVVQNKGQEHFIRLKRVLTQISLFPSEVYMVRRALAVEEELALGRLIMMERAEEGFQRLWTEYANGCKELIGNPFTIDRTTPDASSDYTISNDGTTATKIANSYVTLRTTKPLTTPNHKWAVKIIEDYHTSKCIDIGLLPKLSDKQVEQMSGLRGGYIESDILRGWSMSGDGTKNGDWNCPPFPFAKGDIVVCDLNIAYQTLTLSCGDRKAVGTIPTISVRDELSPAIFMNGKGQKVAFVEYW